MALSPLDIKNKSFPYKMRGYNPEEVDDFIEQVITDYEDVLADRRGLEKALKHAEEKLAYFNELKDALNQSIIVAQDTADKVKDSAVKESNLLVTTATSDAKAIVEKANLEAQQKINEANRQAKEIMMMATDKSNTITSKSGELKKYTREFHRSLTLLLESQLEIVKSKDWHDLLSARYTSSEELDKHMTVSAPVPSLEELSALVDKVTEIEQSEPTSDTAAIEIESIDIDKIIATAKEEVAALEPQIEPTFSEEDEDEDAVTEAVAEEGVERRRKKRTEI